MSRPSPALVISIVALVFAMTGTGYAVVQLPKNSVGSAQLKKEAVTSAKIADDSITSAKVRDGSLEAVDFKAGQLPTGPQGERGPAGVQGPAGAAGEQGPAGAAGAAGTALAYAAITPTPSVDATFSSGVVGVTRPNTGVYCIRLDDSLQSVAFSTSGPQVGEPRRPAVVTPEYGSSSSPSDAYVSNQSTGICGPYRYQVRTYAVGTWNERNDVAFNFVVP